MPGRARLARHVDHAGRRAGRGQPRRPAAPLPDQERPGDRGRRAPQRDARAPSSRRPPPGCRPGGAAPARCWRCSTTTSPAGLHRGARALGGGPHRRRSCTRRWRRWSSGSAARCTGTPSSCSVSTSRRPGVRELVQATLDLVRGLGLANTITDDARPPRPHPRPVGAHPRRRPQGDRVTSNPVLEFVLADLAAEGDRLDALVAGLDEAGWRTPTPAAGWDVATQVAHLAWTDEASLAAATDKAAWDALVLEAIADPDGRGRQGRPPRRPGATRPSCWPGGASSRAALATALRERPDGEKIPWYGPPMSPTSMATARFMETWAHSPRRARGARRRARGRRPAPARGPPRRPHPATSPTPCTASRRRPRSSGSS